MIVPLISELPFLKSQIVLLRFITPIQKFYLGDAPFVDNEKVRLAINNVFNAPRKGVFVLSAPPGAGKSVYLRKYLNLMKSPVRFNDDHNGIIDLKESLHVKPGENLVDYFPPNSVLVFDQFDDETIGADVKAEVVNLAAKARSSGKFSVILSVSQVSSRNEMIKFNGRNKISDLCHPVDFKWGEEKIEEYIKTGFPAWTMPEQVKLRQLAIKAGNPEFLHEVFASHRTGPPKDFTALENIAEVHASKWKDFLQKWVNCGDCLC